MWQLSRVVHKMWSTIIIFVCMGIAAAEYRGDGGFMPSGNYQHTEDQLAEPSARLDKSKEDSQPERTQRFGISAYGSTGSQGPYGGSAPGIYGPVKIDLGGVLLGSILGFGAVVILPKLIHLLSYTYGGGFGRSEDSGWQQVTEMLNNIDESLSRHNIDSAACTQRLACSYVQAANENTITGNATEFDALLTSISNNSLIRRMFDGTAVFEAMSAGRSIDADCHQLYPKCKLDKKTVVKILSQLIPS